ncbi:dnaJ homolog subfamily C member 1-like [Gigantopelta aegis]|uniref:dnaJ homolog subfamily C member 1-like n=1 Tax=Gigantopelta aegis TaxID=1735272 RepID=UPI001B8896B8|nr:dnaJ homolog subfamily C member 1-like [Gigantopelta aegis]
MAATTSRLRELFLILLTASTAVSWDTEELEIFDLVEEINRNFYEVLNVDQSATSTEIKKAYRKLSLQLHPDKNSAPDAEQQFRQMVAVYEVLKDEERRSRYDRVLVEGLPDWRQPVFYYRRVRKLGMLELSGLLALIITIGQYLVAWSVYFERKLSLEDFFESKMKKEQKKRRKNKQEAVDLEEEIQEELKSIPKPRVLDLWPFRFPGFLVYLVKSLPGLVMWLKESFSRTPDSEDEDSDDEVTTSEIVRKPKKKRVEIPVYQAELYEGAMPVVGAECTLPSHDEDSEHKQIKVGKWTDEEMVLLVKANNKFPGGTHLRWEKIADFVGRSVEEVQMKSKTLKGSYSMNLSSSIQGGNPKLKLGKKLCDISDEIITKQDSAYTDGIDEDRQTRRRTKLPKTAERTLVIAQKPAEASKHGTNGVSNKSSGNSDLKPAESEDLWTQNQQMILEYMLRQYPKGTDKRWETIAEHIPGKSTEECMARFKYLVDLVKKKKEAERKDS